MGASYGRSTKIAGFAWLTLRTDKRDIRLLAAAASLFSFAFGFRGMLIVAPTPLCRRLTEMGQIALQERIFEGIPVSPGIAFGRAHIVYRYASISIEPRDLGNDEIEAEVQRFLKAVEASREQLARIRRQVAEALDEKHAEIYTAQSMFLEDPDLIDKTVNAIRTEKRNAEYLFNHRITQFIDVLSKVEDEFFRARDSDILDISNRVTNNLAQTHTGFTLPLAPDSVLVAHDLAPSEATPLVKEHVVAFVLEKGGPTSHTAIMAKALEIPAVVGVPHITNLVENGTRLVVDGLSGKVVINPTDRTMAQYGRDRQEYYAFEKELEDLRNSPAETLDGYAITLRANLELPEEVDHMRQHGARGVGLFRTEFLFLNQETPPSEEAQFRIYQDVARKISPESVVFRTLDVGGDKFFSNVRIASELNPFMGQRAIRLCLRHPEIFRAQLRAILRASAFGHVRVLIPMISGIEELVEVKRHIHRIKGELRHEKIAFDPKIELGAMIEVPSAAVAAGTLARECDFFSIGTNDLIQYSLAVDRGNENVAYLYEPLHPAILQLLSNTIISGHLRGVSVGVCGEMAADPIMAIILLGLGVDELSMSAVSIPPVKKLIRSIRLSEAKLLAEEVLTQSTIRGAKRIVRRRLDNYVRRQKIRKSHLTRFSADILAT